MRGVPWAEEIWGKFRAAPWWVQALLGLIGFWFLAPIFVWSRGTHPVLRWGVTGVCALFALLVGVAIASPTPAKQAPAATVRASLQQSASVTATSPATTLPTQPSPSLTVTSIPTPRPTAAPTTRPSPSPSPTPTLEVRSPDALTFDRTDFRGGFIAEQFQIAVTVTNHDKVARDADVQAKFYDVTGSQLGNDPADHLVTAGTGPVSLQADQTTAVLIKAKNFNHDRIVSVSFSAVCKGTPISFDCGESEPFQ